MGDLVHMTCGACSRSWWSEPGKHVGLLALKLRRRHRNGVSRCPSCYSRQVAPSEAPQPLLPVIDLTAAATVIWLEGVPGKETQDLVRAGRIPSPAPRPSVPGPGVPARRRNRDAAPGPRARRRLPDV